MNWSSNQVSGLPKTNEENRLIRKNVSLSYYKFAGATTHVLLPLYAGARGNLPANREIKRAKSSTGYAGRESGAMANMGHKGINCIKAHQQGKKGRSQVIVRLGYNSRLVISVVVDL